MPDPESSPPPRNAEQGKNYPNEANPATPSLRAILHDRIVRGGAMRFPDFMAAALYGPGLGYYARQARQVGRGGDFFTSVSVGPLFGELLARRFLKWWQAAGSPGKWRIVECGAHDGTLAADILAALSRLDPAAFGALEYAIPEPLPLLQAAQRQTLGRFGRQVRLVVHAAELDPLPGVVFGNELLDALPFHVVVWKSGGWQECRVGFDRDFHWVTAPVDDPALHEALDLLGGPFPEGYRTEVRTNYGDFLKPLLNCVSSGLLLWPDYGFARPEYYLPERIEGTLRTYSNHRAAADPLATPGDIDITAHVDFTAVVETAISLGCKPSVFRSQGAWLTEISRDWLLAMEGRPDPQALRQFRTLVHPAHLGACFHILELSWNDPAAPESGAGDLHRLALRSCRQPATR